MKTTIKLLTLVSGVLTSSAYAETTIPLEDNSAILGEWNMYAETPALHKSKKMVNNKWNFKKNGTLTASSFDPRLDSVNVVSITYVVEDGVIKKQVQPGRSKTENCKVVKLEDTELILHCKYNYYLFKR